MDDRARHAVPSHASSGRSNRERLLAVMAAISLLVAGCGGGSTTPNLSGTPTSGVVSTSPGLASSSPSAASSTSGEPTPVPTDSASSSSASTASSPSPSPSGPVVSPAPTHLPGPAGRPGTVTGARGKVWDALPASFPIYPGLEPAPQPGTPASATLATTGIGAQALIAWYGPALAAAGYTVDAPSAPLEDGSRRLTAHRADQSGCIVDVTIGTKGTMTFVSIGYGAACAFS